MIVILWRAGQRIQEVLARTEHDTRSNSPARAYR